MGGGGKIPYVHASDVLLLFHPRLINLLSYPKHVWSPSGGWYAQPHNWKANTAVMGFVIFGITALAWKVGAEREHRFKMPEPHRFFPSRKYDSSAFPCLLAYSDIVYSWSRQIIEHEKATKSSSE